MPPRISSLFSTGPNRGMRMPSSASAYSYAYGKGVVQDAEQAIA